MRMNFMRSFYSCAKKTHNSPFSVCGASFLLLRYFKIDSKEAVLVVNTDKKKTTPPYVSYGSFINFINKLREETIPDRIDKSSMSNYSGSTIYSLMPALQWLRLIDENGTPSTSLRNIVSANEEGTKDILKNLVRERYDFLFNADFDLSSASSGQVIEAFMAQNISGSTINKSISFFLSIASDSGIRISPHVRPPAARRKSSPKRKKKAPAAAEEASDTGSVQVVATPVDMEKISFSLRGKPDATIHLPKDLDGEEAKRVIEATLFNLKMYYGLTDVKFDN